MNANAGDANVSRWPATETLQVFADNAESAFIGSAAPATAPVTRPNTNALRARCDAVMVSLAIW